MLVLSFGNGCATNSGNQLAAHSGSATPDTFALADADHDGKLSRGEAGDYLVYVVFAISDKNKDARLTQEEWTRGDPTQANALRLRDPNQDGLVTLEEAIVYGRRGGAGVALIRRADRNRDGKLERAEIEAYGSTLSGRQD